MSVFCKHMHTCIHRILQAYPGGRTASDMIVSEKTLIVSLNDLPGHEVNKGKTSGLDQKP